MGFRKVFRLLACIIAGFCLVVPAYPVNAKDKAVAPAMSLLLAEDATTIAKKIPSLALMVAQGTDKIEMAWVPGSDGTTPVGQIKYNIYLSTSENFTPGAANLKKTVTGTSQAVVSGLTADTLYYGKVIAVYAASTSNPSNALQTKTYKSAVIKDPSTTVSDAEALGLGQHTTTDGETYTYTGGTPPATGSVLFSEDTAGGMTVRKVDGSSGSGGTVTVYTSDASLTDVLDRASVYSSFQLFNVASEASGLPQSSNNIAAAQSFADPDGNQQCRMEWNGKTGC